MLLRIKQCIERYKAPKEIMKFFESEMLKDCVISCKLEDLINSERPQTPKEKSPLKRWAVQMMYLAFGLRAAILFSTPILDPGNTLILFLLGDCLSTLGVAVRQMWYAHSINYSILLSYILVKVRRAEKEKQMQFMTTFTQRWASQPQQERLRFKLNLLYICYYAFNISIYITDIGCLILAIFLDTTRRMSISYFIFNALGILLNIAWILYTPNILIQLFVFMWLSTSDATAKLQRVNKIGQELLMLKAPSKKVIQHMIAQFVEAFETANSTIRGYNYCMKHFFYLFRNLYIPIAAANSFVLFTGTFPNQITYLLVFGLSLSQLVMIYFFMSLASTPYDKSVPISRTALSIMARMKDHLSRNQKYSFLKVIKKIRSTSFPVGYTCGDTFAFETRSMAEFIQEVMMAAILALDLIKGIQV